jgi:eukaryotic-like serine/threonine-protein kinase
MTDFSDRVQSAVGAAYRIEKELGGGGMSRVFLAEETGLERKVVVKVLPPEMAAGVNAERFRREILLAARLQHPHIVPLLTAGAKDDLLYYVMPFIQGESLRTRLAREGELPVGQVSRILRDVADALAYAHRQGVVHRDIKPDNVMLADGHAVVTDFGVAKAVESSTGESSLTSLGVALGTPAYMSPEQASADPHVDHRADIYALGAMAYEMLTGQPPFTAASPQSVLVAHVTQAPEHVSVRRETVPPALAEMVMRCLAKKPADRFQQAEEMVPVFDSLLTPSGGMTPTGTQPVPAVDYAALARRGNPLRVGGLFVLAAVGVAAIVYVLVRALGLPDWVFLGAVGLLLAGLPIMLLTGAQERRRAIAHATGMHTMTPTGMKKLFTWRRALAGGGIAFAVLALLAGSFMTLRALGVGPFGTLVTSGKLANRARILVADFTNRSTDPTLGRSLTEAFRIDLSQSPVVRVLTGDEIGAVLKRMERPESTAVTQEVAQEIAERQGIPAVIVGDVAPVGQGYLLSARVLSTGDGSELAADRETAESETGILAALGRLSSSIRGKIGESYRSLRDTRPLEDVTTSSLEALRLYTRGNQTELAGDMAQAAEFYRQAVAADTSFAMAYRKLAVMLQNSRAPLSAVDAAASAAFRHSDRLPPIERGLAAGYYYDVVVDDPGRSIAAYQAALSVDPDQDVALNNLAVEYIQLAQWARAVPLLERALMVGDSTVFQNFQNLALVQYNLGQADSARRTLAAFHRKLPSVRAAVLYDAAFDYADGKWDSAAARARRLSVDPEASAFLQRFADDVILATLTVQGRIAEADALSLRREAIAAQARDSGTALGYAAGRALGAALLADRLDAAGRVLDSALRRYPLGAMDSHNVPWRTLIEATAMAGRADLARSLADQWGRDVPAGQRGADYRPALALVAAAEHHPADARAAFQVAAESLNCNACLEPWIARTWEAQSAPDSALAHYQRYLDEPDALSWVWDGYLRPWVLQRAGDLAAQLGRRQLAVQRYTQFLDLWKNADPDLQPAVRDVRAKLSRLAGAH